MTERRETREWEAIFQAIGHPTIILDPLLRILDVNHAALRLLGRPAEAILGRRCFEVCHEDGLPGPHADCPMRKLETSAARTTVEMEMEGLGGTFLVSCTPVYDNNGKLEKIIHIATDITPRKRAETALRESEERFRTIFESGPLGMVIVNRELRYVRLNEAFCEMLGYSEAELIGRPFTAITHPDDVARDREHVGKLLRGEIQRYKTEKRYRRKDGGTVWGSITATVVRDKQGQFLHFLTMVEDISARRRFEEERLRTKKLESLGILAGGIAHDFNNLLTGVLGNISLAQLQTGPEDKIQDLLEAAKKAASRATHLTKQLLTFSKGGEPVKDTADTAELIKDSAAFALSGSNVKCDLHLPAGLWQLEVDRGQISQVVQNIVINADQAMPMGGVLTVSAQNRLVEAGNEAGLPAGPYVMISFTDQGPGIPGKFLPRIFDPYFSTKQKGSGLGLAICFSIVKKHGGRIKVTSPPGEGATFDVILPAASPSSLPVSGRNNHKELAGKGRLLVMDDEETVRGVAEKILTHLGYQVELTADGQSAVTRYMEARAEGRPFDAVLLDLTVPGGMGGEATLRRLMEYDPHVKAVVSSGFANDAIMARFREHGFMGVVEKPFTISTLGRVMAEVMG